jgi:hypothetical protein
MTDRLTDEEIEALAAEIEGFCLPSKYDLAARALRQLMEERKWRPIDTCPRHKDVLFWREDQGVSFGQYTYCAEWVTEEEQERYGYDEDTLWQEDPWVFLHDGAYRCEGDERPTHWRPLPAPPAQEGAE